GLFRRTVTLGNPIQLYLWQPAIAATSRRCSHTKALRPSLERFDPHAGPCLALRLPRGNQDEVHSGRSLRSIERSGVDPLLCPALARLNWMLNLEHSIRHVG